MVYVLILSFIPNITLLNISLFLATPLHFTTLQCSLKPLYSAVYILFSELQLYIWQSISTFLCTCAVSRVSCSTIPTGWHNYAITEICCKYSVHNSRHCAHNGPQHKKQTSRLYKCTAIATWKDQFCFTCANPLTQEKLT